MDTNKIIFIELFILIFIFISTLIYPLVFKYKLNYLTKEIIQKLLFNSIIITWTLFFIITLFNILMDL